ncbi:MAG TPA: hypothetical protein VJP79_06190 [Nitrososphaera sp.]|nr:hypothetical protein [Nitrososphaera sp.]
MNIQSAKYFSSAVRTIMQLLPDPSRPEPAVPAVVVVVVVVVAGELLKEAARKLLMKKTSAITIIISSKMRDLLLVALTAVEYTS